MTAHQPPPPTSPDVHDRILSASLIGLGGLLSVFIVLAPLAAISIAVGHAPIRDQEEQVIAGLVTALSFGLGLTGLVQLSAGVLLHRRQALGWVLALVSMGAWAMGGLMPLAAYGLWVLLRKRSSA